MSLAHSLRKSNFKLKFLKDINIDGNTTRGLPEMWWIVLIVVKWNEFLTSKTWHEKMKIICISLKTNYFNIKKIQLARPDRMTHVLRFQFDLSRKIR